MKSHPSIQYFSWPLEVGKEWSNKYRLEKPMEKSSVTFARRSLVVGVEEVNVPAGTFQTLKVEHYDPNSGILSAEYWYSPKVKWFVKSRIYRRDGASEAELIGYKAD